MKAIKEFFQYYNWETAMLVLCVSSAGALFLLGIFLSLVYSTAAWLWLWLGTIVLCSFASGL